MGKVKKTLLLGDLHGRWDKTAKVLTRAGVMSKDGTRNDGFRVVQLGDAVSLGYDEDEADFYSWLGKWVDTWCAGNHEVSAWWFNDQHTHLGWDADRWNGWHVGRDREAERLVRQRFMRGEYKVATSIGDWLITHAGVLPKYQRKYKLWDMTAAQAAEWLNVEFQRCMEERSGTGLMEGPDSLFWVRIGQLKSSYRPSSSSKKVLKQVVGHTPSRDHAPMEVVKDLLWCIDSPPVHHPIHGGVVGLLFDEKNEITQLLYEE